MRYLVINPTDDCDLVGRPDGLEPGNHRKGALKRAVVEITRG
jgi:hypothetical protein